MGRTAKWAEQGLQVTAVYLFADSIKLAVEIGIDAGASLGRLEWDCNLAAANLEQIRLALLKQVEAINTQRLGDDGDDGEDEYGR